MRAGGTSKAELMHELMRFSKLLESLENTAWSQTDLASKLNVSTRTVTRYLNLLTGSYGLRLTIKSGSGKNCAVIGTWSFLDALKKQYQGVK